LLIEFFDFGSVGGRRMIRRGGRRVEPAAAKNTSQASVAQ
jgi:hypothetical protein